MKHQFLLLLSTLFITATALGQDFSRQEADSMIIALKKSKKDIDRIDLLLNIAQFHIFKPGEQEIDFDSAKSLINEAKSLNRTVKSSAADAYTLLTESYITKEKGNKEEGKKMAEKAVAMLQTGNNSVYLGRALFELSMYYNYQDSADYAKKIELVNQSITHFDKASDYKGKGRALEMLGNLQTLVSVDSISIGSLQKALATYDTAGYPKLQGVYVLLANAYRALRDFDQSLFYLLKALKTARMLNDTSSQMTQIYNSLALLYNLVERYELAASYTQEALKFSRKHNDEYSTFYLTMNLAYIFDDLKQPDRALSTLATIPKKYLTTTNLYERYLVNMCYVRTYMDLKQPGNAQPYCDTLVRLSGNMELHANYRSNALRLIANHYFDLAQYSKSRYYANKAIQVADSENYKNGRITATKVLYRLDSAEGRYQSAFANLLFYKLKSDSITDIKKERQFDILRVEYEVEMKEDSIKLKNKDIALLLQTTSLQQSNLTQERLARNVTIGGIILASIIIGLLYRQYRHKQKSNQVITEKNEQLGHLLSEKEWLLKEIHHRVKNNLQIVMSLLNSQSAYIDSQPALTAIQNSQHRVHAMSLIHQKLYGAENVSSIDMSLYIRELVTYLADSFNTGQQIRFEYNIEPMEMDVSQAVPLGLILNEAITNSIKYAFPDNRNGIISISLSKTGPNHYLLSISDNGIGIPADFRKTGSLGMSLMKGLSEDLDGDFSIESDNGTTIKIPFVYDPGIKDREKLTTSYISNN